VLGVLLLFDFVCIAYCFFVYHVCLVNKDSHILTVAKMFAGGRDSSVPVPGAKLSNISAPV